MLLRPRWAECRSVPGQAGEGVVGGVPDEGSLRDLKYAHLLGLQSTEPGDIAFLGLMLAVIGKREADLVRLKSSMPSTAIGAR